MAANKTRPEDRLPGDFLESISDDKRRDDARALAALMHDVTGEHGVMWGTSKGCLYIKDLSVVDSDVLGRMSGAAYRSKEAS
jgi:hypothetical protein